MTKSDFDLTAVLFHYWFSVITLYQTYSLNDNKYGTLLYDPPEKKDAVYNYICGDIYSFGLTNCLLFTSGIHNIQYFLSNNNTSILSTTFSSLQNYPYSKGSFILLNE